jgi:hypothetical protein
MYRSGEPYRYTHCRRAAFTRVHMVASDCLLGGASRFLAPLGRFHLLTVTIDSDNGRDRRIHHLLLLCEQEKGYLESLTYRLFTIFLHVPVLFKADGTMQKLYKGAYYSCLNSEV